ncbi:MAG TPA: DUF6298 domain-containing protein [Chitinophagaceae bacterium]|nr:DUF6298 domain-containing protein [Chitinophagaceae bacterium]
MKVCTSTEYCNGKKYFIHAVAICICLSIAFNKSFAQKVEKPLPPLSAVKGKLQYVPDSLGNRVPDFSYCGYKAGEKIIPDAGIKVVVPVSEGDATLRIQSAIDYVSRLPINENGLRGAVLLQKGIYKVEGSLQINTSGVVLRGSGMSNDQTTIIGAGKDRATLIRIVGKNDRNVVTSLNITDDYIPVNSNTIHIAGANNFKPGDNIIITRPSTKEWIEALGTDHFGGGITSLGWKPGQRNIEWVRTITVVNGNAITFDAPLTTALDKKYGGGTIASFTWPGRITNCGVENLQLISEYDTNNEKDEDHRWMAITINNATDTWVRQVSFKHFAGSAVAIYENASRITVEDCISQTPVSEIGGERRNTFFTAGQQILFQRCYAEFGIHDFAIGFCAAGPNAFVQCESKQPFSFSGGIDSWSSGVLFDVVNVDGNAISFLNRGQDGQGAGWNIANSVLWNCSAARIDCYQPPTAQNWAFGSWSQFSGDGYWGESNNSIEPRSLYYAQLKERIGASVNDRLQVMNIETDASSSPSVEVAMTLTKLASSPAKTLLEFISESSQRQLINTNALAAKTIDEIGIKQIETVSKAPVLQIQNGWLVRGNKVITGSRTNVPWWSGNARPYALEKSGIAITRFVPGRIGKGLTDDLNEITDSMLAQNIAVIDQNYGLWYDRRRDDHERVRRMDGEVWPPFYELPFARSGQGTAWDGLSKYDLTKYNHWYWNRLKQFADLADQKGLLLIHQNYFQHNIIEAGAHYADFPWRTANNINNVGFPEPVPYAGDKRIFMAEQFYDTTHPVRRELHKKYIRQCLDNFSDNNGVIQMIGEEFTGPLHFVKFWLNTINEWQKEKGKKQIIGLSTTKDVQDAILNDPAYAPLIDVIDIKYWHYQADGTPYEPKGGQNLAPRQHARLLKPKKTSFEQVYRAVKECRQKYPAKAVVYSGVSYSEFAMAVFMAGGSLPVLPIDIDKKLLQAAIRMKPVASSNKNEYILSDGKNSIVYNVETKKLKRR